MRLDTGRWRIHAPGWRHPAVRTGTELTLGERAADRMRTGMGSWPFVFIALDFLAGWMAGNGRHNLQTVQESDQRAGEMLSILRDLHDRSR